MTRSGADAWRSRARATTGRLTFGDVVALYRQQFQADGNLRLGTKGYKEETLLALRKTWAGLMKADVAKITEKQCKSGGVTSR